MRILLVGNYEPDGQESMRRFADVLERGLGAQGHSVRMIRPAARLGRDRNTLHGAGKWLGYADKFLAFPAALMRAARWADVVHVCDHSNSVYTAFARSVPCLITCHDLLAVRGAFGDETDCPPTPTGRLLQRAILEGLHWADRIACVSDYTRRDVRKLGDSSRIGPVHVVHNGLNHPYGVLDSAAATARLNGHVSLDGRPFVLNLASNLRRKNKRGVMRIFARVAEILDADLVMAGPPLTRELRTEAEGLGISARVREVIKPSNDVLEALYNRALAFLFPSRFEGFGWPLIEAQASGCPVVCSDCGPFDEVVGSSALVYDVEDESGMAEALMRLSEPGYRESVRTAGLRNSRRFTTEAMIEGYEAIYRDMIRN